MLETVQRRWTRNVEGLSEMDYAARLTQLELFSVKGRLLRANLVKYWKIIHGKCGDESLTDVFRWHLMEEPEGILSDC